MNEFPLPDDLSRWPSDPHTLLGVSHGVTPVQLRRAYHRLIRIYKPEHFPEQFRRIREAYDSLCFLAEMFAAREEAGVSPPNEEAQSLDTVEWTAGIPRPVEEEVIAEREQAYVDKLDKLWEDAIAGHPEGAYQSLSQLTQQHAGRTDYYLRLYWLRTLFPDLDARRTPRDWLVQGMLATGLAGPLRQLYREEVTADPNEALSERYQRLLDSPVQGGLLADLIEWRFQAAVRLRHWNVLQEDLVRLRPRFGIGEEQLWLRLLLGLAEGAAWTTDPEGLRFLATCRAEIARHEFLASRMSYFFDRFDHLLEAATGWHTLCRRRGVLATVWGIANSSFDEIVPRMFRRHIPTALLRLLGSAWSRPFGEVRVALTDILESIAVFPKLWLSRFDAIHKLAPATLAQFGELLDKYEEECGMPAVKARDRDQMNDLLSFLPRMNVDLYYGEHRSKLLRFFLVGDVAPEEMAEAAGGFTGNWEKLGIAWAQKLTADWPLRYVCRACRLFWA